MGGFWIALSANGRESERVDVKFHQKFTQYMSQKVDGMLRNRESDAKEVSVNSLEPEMFYNSSENRKNYGGVIFRRFHELYELSLLKFDCCSTNLHHIRVLSTPFFTTNRKFWENVEENTANSIFFKLLSSFYFF